jgi:hypothetical protein
VNQAMGDEVASQLPGRFRTFVPDRLAAVG